MSTKTKYIDVLDAKYISGYKLRLTFNDGTTRVMDFEPFLCKAQHPDITKYRALRKFRSFQIVDGNLMWGDYEMIFPVWHLYRGEI
jgi:uncharacterized protein DUF2442